VSIEWVAKATVESNLADKPTYSKGIIGCYMVGNVAQGYVAERRGH
jgi:hypothetical protein